MNEAEAEAIFSNLKVGSDYIWEPPEEYRERHETIVMRVLSKSVSVGASPGVHIDALWFFITTRDGKTHYTEGHPAGADTGWQRLDSNPQPWTGDRPTRTPLHPRYECYHCEIYLKEKAEECPHCGDAVRMSRIYGGKHDDTCLCEDCTNG